MRRYPLFLFASLSLIFLGSCSSSMIFSPNINLPVKTLKKSEMDLQGSIELFPETRPEAVGKTVTPGGTFLVGYGITDKVGVYGKGWIDFSTTGRYATRSGFSLHAVSEIKQFNSNTKLLVLLKIGVVLDGKYRGGYGAELPFVLHYSPRQKISFYGGFGIMYGLYDFNKINDVEGGSKLQSGYAITNHLGSSVYLYKYLRMNLEFTTLYQHNHFENASNIIFFPSIGIGYTFSRKKSNF